MQSHIRTIILIACSSGKLGRPALARDLYQGTLFRASHNLAEAQKHDEICILSAQYGLVGLDQVIEPYELTLNTMPVAEVRAWSERVFRQLARDFAPEADRFIFLAGEKYRRFLAPKLANVEVPLAGLRIGEQVSWLQRQVGVQDQARSNGDLAEACRALHDIANALPRQRFPLDTSHIPANGHYILFEQGEHAHGGDRIVRIGTHTGDGNLPKRLHEHFETENKDRSIFRKNIGRAMLAAQDSALLEQWNRDLTSRTARERHGDQVDRTALGQVEARVSDYMRDRFSFAVLEVPDRAERLRLERGLIGTVAHCPECKPSRNWLGNESPVDAIRGSGLWQTQHLTAAPVEAAEILNSKRERSVTLTGNSPSRTPRPTASDTRGKGKYAPLGEFLQSAPDAVNLSFAELERILGATLPASARDYRPWWANHDGANKSPQSRAWVDAGFRVATVKLGANGSVHFVRAGGAGTASRAPGRPDSPATGPSQTHGGRARAFQWSVKRDTLQIESESGIDHAYTFKEILTVLRLLHAHFRNNWFPLANNVEKLYRGSER